MRTRVLYNAHAGGAGALDLERLRAVPDVELVDCRGPADTIEAAAAAGPDGVALVVAAGGDGTVHLTANGLMRAGDSAETRPALGVLPCGTGNDLARTLALPLGRHAVPALEALRQGERRTVDVIRVSHPNDGDALTTYAINACAGGFSGAVDEAMTSEMKAAWGPLAYLVGAARALPDLDAFRVRLTVDDGPEETLDAFNVVVANARTAAGGKPIAPRANPEDGRLDIVVVKASASFPLLAARLLAGDYLDDDGVAFRRARRVRVDATPGMWFNVDGELRTDEPVTFEAVPAALRVCVGPDYRADPV